MKMKPIFILAAFLMTSMSSWSQRKFNMDSLLREAAKTELYTPVPPVITTGNTPQEVPSDAVILFNGKDLNAWSGDKLDAPITWTVADGILTVDNSKGYGGINTKEKFTDYQLHIEWRIPKEVTGTGQTRGNSGIFLAFLPVMSPDGKSVNPFRSQGYEVQIMDSYGNPTYVNGQAGSIYKQSIPLANASKEPGAWQTYDIIWKAPRFNGDGSLKSPAYVTVIHNGVLVQDHYELKGETQFVGTPAYHAHGASPIRLQAHGDPGPTVSFRNIWLRKL